MQDMKVHYQRDIKTEISRGFYHPDSCFSIMENYTEKEKPKRFSFEVYTSYLSKDRYQEAFDMFREYVEYLCEYQVEPDKLKNLTKNLLYNFLMELEKFSSGSEELREKYFQMIDQAAKVDAFEKVCREFFENLEQLLAGSEELEDYRIAEIKQYVEQHYQEPLELSDIARRFNFSYSYLSAYFSQTAKEGFSEYLNKVRIEHACRLLESSRISIASVGSNVGYSDHSYFCRVFKKIVGETPTSYRKRRG